MSSGFLSKNVEIKVNKTIILPVVLYGCETWSLTLREEHRLWATENGVLRRIFGPKREGITEGWRKLHNEVHNLYYSSNNTRVIKSRYTRLVGLVARMRDMRNRYKVLVGKSEGKSPLVTPTCRCGDNIRTDLKETGWEGLEWMHLAQYKAKW
jgi:hypothetical protein